MPDAPYRSWVEISRRRIADNYRAAREAVGPEVETVCVVKADAYGHGAIEVSRTLIAEGARWLAVSSAEEGVALRQAGIAARILVMADCQPFARDAVLESQPDAGHPLARRLAGNGELRRAAVAPACPTT